MKWASNLCPKNEGVARVDPALGLLSCRADSRSHFIVRFDIAPESDALNIYEADRGSYVVEYFDAHDRCYVTVFAGPEAEKRACDYLDALKTGRLEIIRDALCHDR